LIQAVKEGIVKLEIIAKKAKGSPRSAPILFIHGSWHGAWCWEENFMPHFASNGFDCYALSLRGHGDSESPKHSKWMRISDYVSDLTQVVDQLPAIPVLVGHSMGGLIVQKYLEKNVVPAAVLIASVPVKGVFRTTLRIARRHFWSFLKANLTWSLYPIIGNPKLAQEAFFSSDISPEKLSRYFDLIQDESYMAFLDMMFLNLPNPEKVSSELLILGADGDAVFYPNEIEATAAAYGCKAEILKGLAHDVMLETEWQKVADRIIGWLDESGV
jgi:alpha-beta hydrolase superfamily lysophospholipase